MPRPLPKKLESLANAKVSARQQCMKASSEESCNVWQINARSVLKSTFRGLHAVADTGIFIITLWVKKTVPLLFLL